MRRRSPTMKERLTPCECCKYPLSERHHLLDFAYHGERNYTIQLCPNCHSLYHLAYQAYILKSKKSKLILGSVILKLGLNNPVCLFIYEKVHEAESVRRQIELNSIKIADLERENDV